MNATPMVEYALEYARRGWPTFPLSPGGKVPAIPSVHPKGDPLRVECKGRCGRDGHGLYDATTDADRIRAWWAERPTANIGLRTGVAFDVLDLDDPDPLAATAAWPDTVELVGGPVVRTASGGWHLYVKPTGRGNATRFEESLADWRGAGGYVVAPPSISATGSGWTWFTAPTLELHQVPAELLNLLDKRRKDTPNRPAVDRVQQSTTGRGNGIAGIVGAVAMAAEGTRNKMLHWAAYTLGLKHHRGEISHADALVGLDAVKTAARSIGLTDDEIDGTTKSGWNAGRLGITKAAS